MIISVGVKKLGWLTSKLVNPHEVADRMQKSLASALSEYGYSFDAVLKETSAAARLSV